MPELPEVETTVKQLRKVILDKKIIKVWCDNFKTVRRVKEDKTVFADFKYFKNYVIGAKIKGIKRRGKNILIGLSDNKLILVHQKLTGHLLVGAWRLEGNKWQARKEGLLREKINLFIHLMFYLSDGLMLALSDVRKFAKVLYGKEKNILNLPEIKNLGPEPLEKNFTFEKFKEIIGKFRGKIKQVLMNQEAIAGIGNIYSDEILWRSKINPFRLSQNLGLEEEKRVYLAAKEILKKAIKLRGESISDWRDARGEKGGYDNIRKVYQREGEKCPRCGSLIQRKKISGRSAHFCPSCQSLSR
ncbi:MAG: DNA-formamidopyrimidine glycosylase [Patescibacteria group bacterium]